MMKTLLVEYIIKRPDKYRSKTFIVPLTSIYNIIIPT